MPQQNVQESRPSSDDLARLSQIKHIVVLMMENRSFDHMLGYLKTAGLPEVNGLSGEERNLDHEGNEYKVHELAADETAFHLPGQPFGKDLDPCHSAECVAEQLAGDNGGIVQNFIASRSVPAEYWGLPMGHYTGEHLPVYDHLARQYCVCDAWHSSIPGDTWSNRLYALAARRSESVGHKPGIVQRILGLLRGLPLVKAIQDAPIFEVEAFTRWLGDEQWRWYSHDPATLRVADKLYRNPLDFKTDNFAFFDRGRVSLPTEILEAVLVRDSFLDDAAKGELRDVSWIDPNFIDLKVFETLSSDDHPPSDVRAGQALALDLYDALVNSPDWNDTLLVITYDEHGGFYDHVAPPAASDGSGYPTLGVRVPALVVGPRVRNFVCHELFDHTCLMKTILLRFAKDPAAAIQHMGPRVERANHLGVALGDRPRTDLADHGHLRDRLETWRREARERRRAAGRDQLSPSPDGAGQKKVLNDFQLEFRKFAVAMREKGLPPGHP
jgi:phospholipase C